MVASTTQGLVGAYITAYKPSGDGATLLRHPFFQDENAVMSFPQKRESIMTKKVHFLRNFPTSQSTIVQESIINMGEPQPIIVKDPLLRHNLTLGLQCLPNQQRHKEYARYLATQYPTEASQIKVVVDCYTKVGSLNMCLKPVGPSPSVELIEKCRKTSAFAEQSIKEGKSSFVRGFPLAIRGLFDIRHFYYSKPPLWLDTFKAALRSKPEWAKRLAAYDLRWVTPKRLDPVKCHNSEEWERHDIEVDGLTYMVPLFLPKKTQFPKWLYIDNFKAYLEILKIFIVPDDFERLLHPVGWGPDLGIYASGSKDLNREVIAGCHMSKDVGGVYQSQTNRIYIINEVSIMSGLDIDPLNHAKDHFISALVHEMGHAIYHILLDGTARVQIARLYHWTHGQLSTKSDITNWKPSDYSMKNPKEFFAELFEEMVYNNLGYRITPVFWIRFPEDLSQSALNARMTIMKNLLFSGINLDALLQENIEAAFRSFDISMKLSPMGEIQSGFVSPVTFGYQSLSIMLGNKPIHNSAMRIGLRPGFLEGLGSVFLGGVGLSLNVTTAVSIGNGEYPAVFDIGLWGQISSILGPINIFIEPATGLRHWSTEEINQTRFWVGGTAGIAFLGGVLAIGMPVQFQIADEQVSYGATLRIDFPSLVRYVGR